MTHFNFKKSTKEFFACCFENPILTVCILVLVPLLCCLPVAVVFQLGQYYGLTGSVADCFCECINIPLFSYTFLPLFIFWMMCLQKYDFSAPLVIRHQNKQIIWLKQVYKIFLSALLMALYVTIWVAILGYRVNGIAYNWMDTNSFFYSPKNTILPPSTIIPIISMFFSLFSLICTAMGMLVLFLQWLTNNRILGFLVILTIPIIDDCFLRYFLDTTIFYKQSSMEIYKWQSMKPIACNLVCPLLWVAVLFLLGKFISKRKDFFNVHQKQTT